MHRAGRVRASHVTCTVSRHMQDLDSAVEAQLLRHKTVGAGNRSTHNRGCDTACPWQTAATRPCRFKGTCSTGCKSKASGYQRPSLPSRFQGCGLCIRRCEIAEANCETCPTRKGSYVGAHFCLTISASAATGASQPHAREALPIANTKAQATLKRAQPTWARPGCDSSPRLMH